MCTSLFGDTSDTTSSGLAQRLGMYPQLVLLPARWDPPLHVLGQMTSEVKVFILGTSASLLLEADLCPLGLFMGHIYLSLCPLSQYHGPRELLEAPTTFLAPHLNPRADLFSFNERIISLWERMNPSQGQLLRVAPCGAYGGRKDCFSGSV